MNEANRRDVVDWGLHSEGWNGGCDILVEGIELTGIRAGLVESHLDDGIEQLEKSSSLGTFYVLGLNNCYLREYWTADDDMLPLMYTLSLLSVFRPDAFAYSYHFFLGSMLFTFCRLPIAHHSFQFCYTFFILDNACDTP